MKVFCIDGVVVETNHEPTRADLECQAFMPIEDQPIMAGVLPRDIPMLTPMTADSFIGEFGGRMLEDRNTETFADVSEAMGSENTEWPES